MDKVTTHAQLSLQRKAEKRSLQISDKSIPSVDLSQNLLQETIVYKILLVEDEDILRETYGMILNTQPYEVDIVSNGIDALRKCEESVYDLILLDLMMPYLDGVGFLERFIPTSPPETKVIVLSNLSSGKELSRAMELGAHSAALKADLAPRELLSMIDYELEAV